jgi:hypothetical protein
MNSTRDELRWRLTAAVVDDLIIHQRQPLNSDQLCFQVIPLLHIS